MTTVSVAPMPADDLAELRREHPDVPHHILVRLHAGGATVQHSPEVQADELARIVATIKGGAEQ